MTAPVSADGRESEPIPDGGHLSAGSEGCQRAPANVAKTFEAIPIRVALLTPPGRGALGVVGVAGPGAVAAVARLFTPPGAPPWAARPDGSIAFGRWGNPACGEELIVVRHSASRLEVHCHGGLAASAAILTSLEAGDAIRQPWAEWLRANGVDEIEVEAREALSRAAGPKAVRILCRQLGGSLQSEIDRIAALRTTDGAAADRAVERLLRASRVGLRLTRPWRVVVAGPVNAGKSSLVNALAGYARSIVSAEPGTTRDLVETRLVLDGWEIDLIDTAGLRGDEGGDLESASATERAGIGRALIAAASADLVVQVGGPCRLPSGIGSPVLRVVSKCDLTPQIAAPPGVVRTSAVTGEGIDALAAAIVRNLVPEEAADPSLLAGPVPFTSRQLALLDRHRKPEPTAADRGSA